MVISLASASVRDLTSVTVVAPAARISITPLNVSISRRSTPPVSFTAMSPAPVTDTSRELAVVPILLVVMVPTPFRAVRVTTSPVMVLFTSPSVIDPAVAVKVTSLLVPPAFTVSTSIFPAEGVTETPFVPSSIAEVFTLFSVTVPPAVRVNAPSPVANEITVTPSVSLSDTSPAASVRPWSSSTFVSRAVTGPKASRYTLPAVASTSAPPVAPA